MGLSNVRQALLARGLSWFVFASRPWGVGDLGLRGPAPPQRRVGHCRADGDNQKKDHPWPGPSPPERPMHVLKAASRAPRPARTVSGLDEYASTWPPVPDEDQLTRGGFP